MSDDKPFQAPEFRRSFKGGVAVAFAIPLLLSILGFSLSSLARALSIDMSGYLPLTEVFFLIFIGFTQIIYIGPLLYLGPTARASRVQPRFAGRRGGALSSASDLRGVCFHPVKTEASRLHAMNGRGFRRIAP
jgi:hypothetical protein